MTADLEAGFDAAADRYDLLVALNPGYHRHLRAAARALAEGLPDDARLALDLGCGSGASTRALADAAPGLDIVGIDASDGMLHRARRKNWRAGVEFVHADARDLERVLAERGTRPVDGILAAYLVRNVPQDERDALLASFAEALRPGGRLVLQEYSVAGRPLAAAVWTLVCGLVVIPLAALVRGRPALYRYLWRSVRRFDSTERLARRLRDAGFVDVSVETVGGWKRGILHTITGRRP